MAETKAHPTPDRIMQTFFGHAPTQALCAALDLDLFTHIKNGHHTAADVAGQAGASARGVSSLLDVMAALGFLSKDGERYALTADSEAFLLPSSPAYLGGLRHQVQASWQSWASLGDAVRQGSCASRRLEADRGEFFAGWVDALFALNRPGATAVARHLGPATGRILDIGAGSGVWGLSAAEQSPQARVTFVDLQPVLDKVTRPTAQRMGVAERCEFVVGDFHQAAFPSGCQRAYLGHILHSEPHEANIKLLKRVAECLQPGGTLVIAEMVADEDRKGPVFALLFDMNMLVHTEAGKAYTGKELEEMCLQSGFTSVEWLSAPANSPLLLARR
jgi:SAM-dependent methyltransferase